MRLHAIALVATLLAAGCLTNAPSATQDAAIPDELMGVVGRAGVFHDGVAAGVPAALGGEYLTGAAATEPTIGVTPEGVVFMTAMMKNPTGRNQPTLMRSMDKGQTWEAAGPITHVNTNDPMVYVDPDTGRVFMSDILPLSCTFLSWSDDAGESWTTNPYACGNSQVNDHQTIVAAWPRTLPVSPLYPKIVYICTNDVAYLACATSLNGGLTFGPQIPVDHGLDEGQQIPVCGAIFGHIRAGPDGKVYLPKSDCSIQSSAPSYYVTDNDGLTWTKHIIAPDARVAGHEVGFAIDEENNLYATWPGEDGRQYFSASAADSGEWSAPLDITAPGVTATDFTAIAARGVGKVAFAYIGSTVEEGYEGKGTGNAGLTGDILGQPALPEWDDATWNAYIGIMTDALSGKPIVQSVTTNDPEDPVAKGLCGRTRCHGMNDFIDMVVDADGRPWVAFVDVCHDECVAAEKPMSDGAIGFAGTTISGPALLTDAKELAALAPPPAP
ncbi:MAG TPA: sialidase family protein [Candidatus Thermoplasmatota archaeon]|nr:sialidase family protein [Candidatus Thermoplasmatota archaeon]